jgi:hypothetical protein
MLIWRTHLSFMFNWLYFNIILWPFAFAFTFALTFAVLLLSKMTSIRLPNVPLRTTCNSRRPDGDSTNVQPCAPLISTTSTSIDFELEAPVVSKSYFTSHIITTKFKKGRQFYQRNWTNGRPPKPWPHKLFPGKGGRSPRKHRVQNSAPKTQRKPDNHNSNALVLHSKSPRYPIKAQASQILQIQQDILSALKIPNINQHILRHIKSQCLKSSRHLIDTECRQLILYKGKAKSYGPKPQRVVPSTVPRVLVPKTSRKLVSRKNRLPKTLTYPPSLDFEGKLYPFKRIPSPVEERTLETGTSRHP